MVHWGRLAFRDFTRLDPVDVRRLLADPGNLPLLSTASNNAPDILLWLLRACPDLRERLLPLGRDSASLATTAIAHAREELVWRHAFVLLRAKSPALYDCLPWHDWDIGAVTGRFRIWRTRILVASECASVTACRLNRSAGVWVLTPYVDLGRYIATKAARCGVRRLAILNAELEQVALPNRSVDLAIVGPNLGSRPESSLAELHRLARTVLYVAPRPDAEPPVALLERTGFIPDSLRLTQMNIERPCWWLKPPALTDDVECV